MKVSEGLEIRVSKSAEKALKKSSGERWKEVVEYISQNLISGFSREKSKTIAKKGLRFTTNGKINIESCETLYHFSTDNLISLSTFSEEQARSYKR